MLSRPENDKEKKQSQNGKQRPHKAAEDHRRRVALFWIEGLPIHAIRSPCQIHYMTPYLPTDMINIYS